jgi:hypothetical protein
VSAVAILALGIATQPATASDAPAWTLYGEADNPAETASYSTASSAGIVASSEAAFTWRTGADTISTAAKAIGLRPSRDPEGGSYYCAFYLSAPYGHWERPGSLHAYVLGDVNCNFESAEISYTVQFRGYDAASGGFIESGNTTTCYSADYCRGGVSYHNTEGACSGSFDHYGVAYGSYRAPDGSSQKIVGDGVDGPHKAGESMSDYC